MQAHKDIDAFEEQRLIVTGMDFMGHILTVVYTYRYGTIRLIPKLCFNGRCGINIAKLLIINNFTKGASNCK